MTVPRAKGLLALPLVLVLSLGLLHTGAASAHAVFISAQPAPGARLAQPPAAVRIVFSEPLNGGLSGIDLFDAQGALVRARSAGVDRADGRAYVLVLPLLRPDRYTVLWHTVSLVDGHARRGSYSFSVLRPNGTLPASGASPLAIAPPRSLPGMVAAAAKWLALLGLFLVAGPALLTLLARDSRQSDALGGPLARAFAVTRNAGIMLLLVGSAGQLLDVWLPAGGWGVAGAVLLSRFGIWWLIRAALTLFLAAWAITGSRRVAWRRVERRRATAILAMLFVALIALTFSATSHGAAASVAWWGTAFDLVHLLAAALWIGGAGALALVLLMPVASISDAIVRRLLVQRFSIAAGMAVAAVLISGAGSGVIEFGSIHDLLTTAYGRWFDVKLGLVAVLLAAAAANAFLLRPAFQSRRLTARRFRWMVLTEALLGVAVLIPVAAMSTNVPARSQDQARAVAAQIAANTNPASQFTGDTVVGTVAAELSITPGALGINQVRVELASAVRTPSLQLSMLGPDGRTASATLTRTGTELQPGGGVHTVYGATIRLAGAAGTWRAGLASSGGTGAGPSLIVPVAGATGADVPFSAPPAGVLAALLLALLGAVAIAAARALRGRGPRFAALGLGSAGLAAALVIGLAPVRGSGAPPPRQASWGVATVVAPHAYGSAQVWTIPTANVGLMIPAVGPDGSLWISEMNTNKLARLSPQRDTVREYDFGASYKGTMGAVVDHAGRVWLAQESVAAIGLFDPTTGAYREFRTPTAASGPSGIALDSAGNVWFTELNTDKIGRFDPLTYTFHEFAIPTPMAAPYWPAVAPDGRIWFTELAAARVGVLDPTTGEIREYLTPNLEQPAGIAVDAAGDVWVGTLNGYLIQMRPTPRGVGVSMTQYKTPATGVYGIAVGSNGTIWLGTTGRSAYAFDARSSRFQTYTLPTNSGAWWPVLTGNAVWVALGSQAGNGLARIQVATAAARTP